MAPPETLGASGDRCASAQTEGGAPLAVDSVLAVPALDWHMDYIQPQVRCVRENGECIDIQYPAPPESSKVGSGSGITSSSVWHHLTPLGPGTT